MLFSRVYNWIKYKTLPPSILFLNRLFVERDSKHRRVLSNLGLTFRNSKWSMYARINVQEVGYAYFCTFALTVFTITTTLIIIYYNFSYYHFTLLSNYVFTQLWFFMDIEIYTSSFYVFLSWVTIEQVTLFIHRSFLIVWLTSVENKFTCNSKINASQTSIPKRFYKSILYKWSTVNTTNTIDIFESNIYTRQSGYQMFYATLYNLVKLFNQEKNTLTEYKRLLQTCSVESQLTTAQTFNLTKLLPQLQCSLQNMLLFDYKVGIAKKNSVQATREFNSWTLDQIGDEKWSLIKNTSTQPFYVTHITYSAINQLISCNSELRSLLVSLEAQTNLRSIHKWIYKYNLLHRSSLRDPSQLSFLLKHVAPSFYMSTFFSRNIWTSSTLKANELQNINLGSCHEALYASNSLYLKDSLLQLHPLFRNLNNFSHLTLYTTSYNWVLQRFHVFNSLPTHVMRWTTNLSHNVSSYTASWVHSYGSSLLHFQWYLHIQCANYFSPFRPMLSYEDQAIRLKNIEINNDVYLSYVEYNIFSKLNLETGVNLTANQGSPRFTFYNVQPLLS